MYTEFCLGLALKEDVSQEVVDVLEFMCSKERDAVKPPLPNHPLFNTERWEWMLRSGGSYYFNQKPVLRWEYDDISRQWYLTVWTNIKNYSNEIGRFLEWVAPHLEDVELESMAYLGFTRYEEEAHPTLIYLEDKKIKLVNAETLMKAAHRS